MSATQVTTSGVTTPPVVTSQQSVDGTVAFVNKSGSLTCSADYSNFTTPGPNCCEGIYTYTLNSIVDGVSTVTTSIVPWGGVASNCLEGPAMKSQALAGGYPVPTLYFLQGITRNNTYTAYAPIKAGKPDYSSTVAGFVSDITVANYFCPGGICPTGGNVAPNGSTLGTLVASGGYRIENAPAATQAQPTISFAGNTTLASSTLSGMPPIVQTINGNDTNGSNTITAMASTVGINIGAIVTGVGIPIAPPTTVIAIGSSTVGLSQAATSTNAATPFTFQNIPLGVFANGPGIPQGTIVTAAGANSVTLSQVATATVAGGTYVFSVSTNHPFLANSSNIPPANPFYEFVCYDNNEDVLSRLRVQVRTWTTNSALNAAFAANGVAVGANPFICGPEASYPDQPLYDRWIWPLCFDPTVPFLFGYGEGYPQFGI